MKKESAAGSPVTIGIPVRGYLKKFLHWSLNLSLDEKIDLSENGNDPIVKVIAGTLSGKLKIEMFYSSDDNLPREGYYDDQLQLVINHRRFQYNQIHIDRDTSRFIDSYLHGIFHSHLLLLVRTATKNKLMNEMQCIEVLCELMQIGEDDISFDALKKATWRLRTAKKLPTFR